MWWQPIGGVYLQFGDVSYPRGASTALTPGRSILAVFPMTPIF